MLEAEALERVGVLRNQNKHEGQRQSTCIFGETRNSSRDLIETRAFRATSSRTSVIRRMASFIEASTVRLGSLITR